VSPRTCTCDDDGEEVSEVADQDEGIEFIPTDEIVETEAAGAEDDAVHVQDADQPKELMTVEAEEFDAADLAPDVAEELEVEADEAVEADAETEASEEAVEEEHEEDLEEIVRRHYGIVSAEPEVARARRPTGVAEFVCASCFLRRPAGQLADPARSICVDGATNGG
jgi:hypothetical protein